VQLHLGIDATASIVHVRFLVLFTFLVFDENALLQSGQLLLRIWRASATTTPTCCTRTVPASPPSRFPRPLTCKNTIYILIFKLLINSNSFLKWQQQQGVQQRHPAVQNGPLTESRTPTKEEQAKLGSSEPRTLLKLLGFDYLANYVINSLTFSTTSTTYTTVTSTVTVGTILTCYTKTMFKSTTACRRKRRLLPGLLIGDDGFETPSKVER